MPGRKYSAGSSYRYGFNGKENDNDVKNVEGGQQDYGMRIYDPRVAKFLSVDPLTPKYPELTPYQFASNRPIDGIDLDGLEWWKKYVWLISPTIAAANDKEIREGFLDRAKQTLKGIKEAIKNTEIPKLNTTIADPRPPKGDIRSTVEQMQAAGRAIYDDYKNLFAKGIKGDKRAIGGLIFEGITVITPGAEEIGGAIKGLRYAGEFAKCAEYVAEFGSKVEPLLAKIGAKAQAFEIRIVEDGVPKGAYIATTREGLSTSGMHQFVQVTTRQGLEIIYDNMHPNGILRTDYIKEIAARIEWNGKIVSGEQIFREMITPLKKGVQKPKK